MRWPALGQQQRTDTHRRPSHVRSRLHARKNQSLNIDRGKNVCSNRTESNQRSQKTCCLVTGARVAGCVAGAAEERCSQVCSASVRYRCARGGPPATSACTSAHVPRSSRPRASSSGDNMMPHTGSAPSPPSAHSAATMAAAAPGGSAATAAASAWKRDSSVTSAAEAADGAPLQTGPASSAATRRDAHARRCASLVGDPSGGDAARRRGGDSSGAGSGSDPPTADEGATSPSGAEAGAGVVAAPLQDSSASSARVNLAAEACVAAAGVSTRQ